MRPTDANRKSLVLLGQGFSFAAMVGIMALIGWKLDEWLATEPWLLIVGAMSGVALATYDLLRTVAALDDKRGGPDR